MNNNRRLTGYVTPKEAVLLNELAITKDTTTSEILRQALRSYLITLGKLKTTDSQHEKSPAGANGMGEVLKHE